MVTRQLWLLALPVGLDLFLWLGPRLNAAGLWSLFQFAIPPGLDAQTRLFAQDLQVTARQAIESANWFGGLRPLLFGVPGLVSDAGAALPDGSRPIEWVLASPVVFFAVLLALMAIGVGLGGLYWSLIARQVRDGRIDWAAALGRMSEVWPKLIGQALILIGLALLIWLLAAALSLALGAASGLLGALVVMLALSLLIWLLFYLSFSVHGVVLYNQSVIEAMRASIWLGRAHFAPTLGLLCAVIAVEWGMRLIWNLAPSDSWLWAISIGGNAFVVAGLSTATVVYYADRVPIPRSTLAET